jgi:hypothetical protein
VPAGMFKEWHLPPGNCEVYQKEKSGRWKEGKALPSTGNNLHCRRPWGKGTDQVLFQLW